MKSPLLTTKEHFLKWMQTQGWSEKYQGSYFDQPQEYPCIAVNHFYMDYDNRERDHLTFISLSDFNLKECEFCEHLIQKDLLHIDHGSDKEFCEECKERSGMECDCCDQEIY